MCASPVEAHYNRPQLEQTILQALARAGKDTRHVSALDLAPVDEFHVGGLDSTKELATLMNLHPGMRLLDVGCGIGGPARYFAAEHGCKVTGVDLTDEFVRTAQALTRLVNLETTTEFRHASALELPFEEGAFDGAYMIHVGMNVPDKTGVFREVARVIKPGARFTIFDFMRRASSPFTFPVPWALSEATSAVAEPSVYRSALQEAGLRITHERSRVAFAIAFTQNVMERLAQSGPPLLGLHLLMGDKTPVMARNMLDAMQRGVLEPIEMIGEKV
jgi:SAM-dependent methyltransferase